LYSLLHFLFAKEFGVLRLRKVWKGSSLRIIYMLFCALWSLLIVDLVGPLSGIRVLNVDAGFTFLPYCLTGGWNMLWL
jgi:hypothetical protein